ncbi:MAG: hypothetical protein ACLU4J_05210 [Butyricimonas paravirosa]
MENLIYNALRLKYKEIYYLGVEECDFVVVEKGTITQAIQVCLDLNADNRNENLMDWWMP